MTVEKVSIKPRRIELTADGVLTDFDFDFKIFAEDEVEVYLRDLAGVSVLQTITTDYTVAFDSEAETGTISFVTAPTDLFVVLMVSSADYEQSTDIPKGGGFSEPVIEKAYDVLAIQIQQLRDDLNRAVTLSTTSPLSSVTLPAANAGKALLWNATADDLENSTDDFNDIVTDATAQAVLAAASAASAAADLVLTNADVVLTNADVVLTNADVLLTNADVVLTGLDVGYAREWAIEPEDDPVSVAAGGDNLTTFSALHWAAKAAASAVAADSTEVVTQATHGLSVGDWVYNNGTIYALADASAEATANSIGVVSAVADVNTFTLQFDGKVSGLSGLTKGSVHYISEVAGQITTAAPVTVGAFVKPVLIADSTTTGFVFNQLSVENEAAGGGATIFRDTFVNADLPVVTINHAIGEKIVMVQVFDENDDLVQPDDITLTDTNNLDIDLTSFGTIAGTWNVVVIG